MAVLRDVQRGRDLEQILTQYTTFVKPAFEEFCLPVRPLAAGLFPCPLNSLPPLPDSVHTKAELVPDLPPLCMAEGRAAASSVSAMPF